MHSNADTRKDDLATFVTIPEAASRMGVSPDTIRRRIKSGELPAGLFAGKYRIRMTDLEALVRVA